MHARVLILNGRKGEGGGKKKDTGGRRPKIRAGVLNSEKTKNTKKERMSPTKLLANGGFEKEKKQGGKPNQNGGS